MMLDSHAHPAQMSGNQPSQSVRAAIQQNRLDEALRRNGGGRAWRAWKAGQLAEVMKDLTLASPRIDLLHIEIAGDLELVYGVEMPVPLAPQPIWHPNVAPDLKGVMCLGALPPNTNLKEIILLGYYTLTLQEMTINEMDPAGVLNSDACDYYRSHPQCLPLCGEGLLEPWAGLEETRRRLDL